MHKLKNPIRIGVLGCGSFAQRRILPAAQEVEAIKIVAVQKRNLSEAKEVASKFNIPYAVSTREALIEHPEVDVVFIATLNHMHEEDAVACAMHSKPVLCEKPLAPTSAAILRMIEAFEKQSVPLLVGHSLRFKFAVQKARQLLQSGALGQLLSIRAHFSPHFLKDNWRHEQLEGGGVLQDIGVHLIDLIRFISGEEIESISAMAHHEEKNRADQTVSAICRLGDSASASFECSFVQPFSSGFEVIGTKAHLVSRDSLRQTYDSLETLSLIDEQDVRTYFPIRGANIYVDELKHFGEVLQGKTSSILSATEGMQNQKVIEAAYESMRRNSGAVRVV